MIMGLLLCLEIKFSTWPGRPRFSQGSTISHLMTPTHMNFLCQFSDHSVYALSFTKPRKILLGVWYTKILPSGVSDGCYKRGPVAHLVEYRISVREVVGPKPSRTNTQGIKITEGKVLPL